MLPSEVRPAAVHEHAGEDREGLAGWVGEKPSWHQSVRRHEPATPALTSDHCQSHTATLAAMST